MLTTPQKTALKAAILADNILAAKPNNSVGNLEIAQAFAAVASPDFWVWKSFVADQDIYAVTVEGVSWSWTIYIGRSQGERDAWRQMVNMAGGLNPSLAQVRTGIADIFSGAGGAAQRTFLLTLGRRLANRAEKLLATGTGSTASPANMGFEGTLTTDDIEAARNS